MPDEDKLAADRLSRALADYDDSSRQVSTNNRYISFGLVAITYTLLSSDAAIAKQLVQANGTLILVVGALGCLGVIFDYLHYMCAVRVARNAIDNRVVGHEHQNNKKWPSFVWRERFYKLRTIAAMVGASLLIVLIGLSWLTINSTANQGLTAVPLSGPSALQK